jgi:hypothetical protein
MKITHNAIITLDEIAKMLDWDMTEVKAAQKEKSGGATVIPTGKMINAFLKVWKTAPFAGELQKMMKEETLDSVTLMDWGADPSQVSYRAYGHLRVNNKNLEKYS